MKIFGWTIERESEVRARDMRWFGRGFDAGWHAATEKAVKTFNQHGFTVLSTTGDLKEKLRLQSELINE